MTKTTKIVISQKHHFLSIIKVLTCQKFSPDPVFVKCPHYTLLQKLVKIT